MLQVWPDYKKIEKKRNAEAGRPLESTGREILGMAKNTEAAPMPNRTSDHELNERGKEGADRTDICSGIALSHYLGILYKKKKGSERKGKGGRESIKRDWRNSLTRTAPGLTKSKKGKNNETVEKEAESETKIGNLTGN